MLKGVQKEGDREKVAGREGTEEAVIRQKRNGDAPLPEGQGSQSSATGAENFYVKVEDSGSEDWETTTGDLEPPLNPRRRDKRRKGGRPGEKEGERTREGEGEGEEGEEREGEEEGELSCRRCGAEGIGICYLCQNVSCMVSEVVLYVRMRVLSWMRQAADRTSLLCCAETPLSCQLTARQLREIRKLYVKTRIAIEPSCSSQIALLQGYWTGVFGPSPMPELGNPLWQLAGFQSSNPWSDFRGGGLCALELMHYFALNHPRELTQIASDCCGAITSATTNPSDAIARPYYYPFAASFVNIEFALINFFRISSLHRQDLIPASSLTHRGQRPSIRRPLLTGLPPGDKSKIAAAATAPVLSHSYSRNQQLDRHHYQSRNQQQDSSEEVGVRSAEEPLLPPLSLDASGHASGYAPEPVRMSSLNSDSALSQYIRGDDLNGLEQLPPQRLPTPVGLLGFSATRRQLNNFAELMAVQRAPLSFDTKPVSRRRLECSRSLRGSGTSGVKSALSNVLSLRSPRAAGGRQSHGAGFKTGEKSPTTKATRGNANDRHSENDYDNHDDHNHDHVPSSDLNEASSRRGPGSLGSGSLGTGSHGASMTAAEGVAPSVSRVAPALGDLFCATCIRLHLEWLALIQAGGATLMDFGVAIRRTMLAISSRNFDSPEAILSLTTRDKSTLFSRQSLGT